MRLRFLQTFQRRPSLSNDHIRIDYEASDDESLPSSPISSETHRLSSSTGTYPISSTLEKNHQHLHQSTPVLSHNLPTD